MQEVHYIIYCFIRLLPCCTKDKDIITLVNSLFINWLICCLTAKDIFSQCLVSVWVKTIEPEFKVCQACGNFYWSPFLSNPVQSPGTGLFVGIFSIDCSIWMIWVAARVYGNVSLMLLKLRCPTGSSVYFFWMILCFFSCFYVFIFFCVLFWYSYSMEVEVISSLEQPFALFKPHYVTNAVW